MHTIKFRGQILDGPRKGEWVYGSYLEVEVQGVKHARIIPIFDQEKEVLDGTIDIDCIAVDPKTVGQYIGVRDHNAKEIFGGDIVKWDDGSAGIYWRVAQVVYMPGFWRFEIIPGKSINCFKDGQTGAFDGGSFMYLPNTSAHNNIMEVIGSIHSNPDLLTQ